MSFREGSEKRLKLRSPNLVHISILMYEVECMYVCVTVGELKVSPWLTAPGMEDEQLGRRGLSASQPMAERD